MIVVFGCILLLCLFRVDIAGRSKFQRNYLSAEGTLAVKGLFTLLIFLSHFANYIPMKNTLDAPYAAIKAYLGQAIVGPFLFLSGYGVFVSIRDKRNYVEQMPLKRILHTLFCMHAALLLYFITQTLRGQTYTLRYILKTLISWESFGNSDWYIFSILALYSITYFSFLVFGKKKRDAGLIICGAVMLVFTLFMKQYKSGYWYNIYFVYWTGMLYARWKAEIDESVMQCDRTWLLTMAAAFAAFGTLHIYRNDLIAYEGTAVCFSLLVVLLSMKVSLKNPLLVYCGKHLFSLFILQRLPMLVLRGTFVSSNDYVFFIICLAVTFLLSAVFDRAVPALWQKVQKRIGSKTCIEFSE